MTTRHNASRVRVPDPIADNEAVNRRVVLQRDGGLNTVPTLYRSITRRFERPFNIPAFGDSRFEGISSNAADGVGAPTWGDTWPILLVRALRAATGLPQGGRGWLPLQLTDVAAQYRFKISELRAGSYSNQRDAIGIPGSQYMTTVASGGQRIRLFTDPNATNVDMYVQSISNGGYAVRLRTQLGTVIDRSPATTPRTQVIRVPKPGSWIEIESTAGGFYALGAMEYAGDETSGIRALNFGVSGATSAQGAGAVTKIGMADLLALLTPSMVLVGYGGNDYLTTASTTALTSNINLIKSTLAVPLMVSTAITTGGMYTGAQPYNVAIRASNWDVLMDPATLGTVDTDFPGWFSSDGVHFSQSGTSANADIAFDALMGRQATPSGPSGRLVTTDMLDRRALDWVNVRDFGAVGDGVADDTLAVNTACSAAIAMNRPLYFPGGYYPTTQPLPTLPSNFVIRGDGSRSSTIMYTGTGTLVSAASVQNVRLYDLDFYTTAAGATLFDLSACFVWTFTGCLIRGNHPNGTTYQTQRGIVFRDNTGGCRIIDCDINNLGRAITTSCIQNHISMCKFATNYIGVLGTGSNNSAGMNMTMIEFDSPKDGTTTYAHVWIDGPANEWNFTQVWWEGGDKSLIVGNAGVGGPSKFFMSGCKMAARTVALELNHCRQPHIVNTEFDIDQGSVAGYKEISINTTYCVEGVADNLITTVRGDFVDSDFPQYWSVRRRGNDRFGNARVNSNLDVANMLTTGDFTMGYEAATGKVFMSTDNNGNAGWRNPNLGQVWDPEMTVNAAAIAAGYTGYSDAIGGVQVNNPYSTTGVLLDTVGFRLDDPTQVIGGTGSVQVQLYLGSPTAAETSLMGTLVINAGQNNATVTLAIPVECAHNAVLRAKIITGTATIPGPCRIHWRSRYA